MLKGLYLKKSQIPRAGKGLFTKHAIAKGETIVEYTGRVRTWAEVKENDGNNAYLFYITAKKVLDPSRQKNMMAKYANDAKGVTRINGLRNNAEYQVRKQRCFIVATKNIKPTEEIFVGYGPEYWKIMKEEHGMK
jgi:uncharacterized protein